MDAAPAGPARSSAARSRRRCPGSARPGRVGGARRTRSVTRRLCALPRPVDPVSRIRYVRGFRCRRRPGHRVRARCRASRSACRRHAGTFTVRVTSIVTVAGSRSRKWTSRSSRKPSPFGLTSSGAASRRRRGWSRCRPGGRPDRAPSSRRARQLLASTVERYTSSTTYVPSATRFPFRPSVPVISESARVRSGRTSHPQACWPPTGREPERRPARLTSTVAEIARRRMPRREGARGTAGDGAAAA